MSEPYHVVYCWDEDDSGQWASHPANQKYPDCATNWELIELVKEKDQLDNALAMTRNVISVRRLEKVERRQKCIDTIKILAYSKWPEGNWESAPTLTVATIPDNRTVIIQPNYGNEEILVVDPNAIIIKP
jgi:hypothetical protein